MFAWVCEDNNFAILSRPAAGNPRGDPGLAPPPVKGGWTGRIRVELFKLVAVEVDAVELAAGATVAAATAVILVVRGAEVRHPVVIAGVAGKAQWGGEAPH